MVLILLLLPCFQASVLIFIGSSGWIKTISWNNSVISSDTNYARLYPQFDKETVESASKNRFSYFLLKGWIVTKTKSYLISEKRFFQMPDKTSDKNKIILISIGSQQIL